MDCRHRIMAMAAAWLVVVFGSTSAFAQEWTHTEVFVTPEETAELIDDGAVVVDARQADDYEGGHISTAANLFWRQFVDGEASGEITGDDARLTRLLRRAGISQNAPVIVYGNWSGEGAWGEEGRIFWTLEYLGHDEVYVLEGGIDAWREAGYEIDDQGASSSAPGDFEVRRQQQRRITTGSLYRSVAQTHSVEVVDTREPGEYAGEVKYGEERGGHIPGAEHLWWRAFFDDDGDLKSPREIGRKLSERGLDQSDDIVVYCTGGIRSGFVYAVLRAKGFDGVRNYDASMWEWTQNGAPVATPDG